MIIKVKWVLFDWRGGVGWGGGEGVEDGFSEEGANEDPSCAL